MINASLRTVNVSSMSAPLGVSTFLNTSSKLRSKVAYFSQTSYACCFLLINTAFTAISRNFENPPPKKPRFTVCAVIATRASTNEDRQHQDHPLWPRFVLKPCQSGLLTRDPLDGTTVIIRPNYNLAPIEVVQQRFVVVVRVFSLMVAMRAPRHRPSASYDCARRCL